MGRETTPGGTTGAKLLHLQQVMDAGRQIHGAMDRVDTAMAETLGINRSDLRCLYHLIENEASTPGEIAAAVGLTSGSVTAMLDRLEGQCLVVRIRSCADRRSVAISLLPEKRVMVAGVMERKLSTIQDHFASLDDAELARLAAALTPYAAIISSIADEMSPSET